MAGIRAFGGRAAQPVPICEQGPGRIPGPVSSAV